MWGQSLCIVERTPKILLSEKKTICKIMSTGHLGKTHTMS